MKDLNWYLPEQVMVFEHDGVRWFTDSFVMAPIRRYPETLPSELGRHLELSDEDFEDHDSKSYYHIKNWDPAPANACLNNMVELRNADRKGAAVLIRPSEDYTPLAMVYERLEGILMNRIYLEVVGFIADRSIDGFGFGGSPRDPVTLYQGDEMAGLLMPVLPPSDDDLSAHTFPLQMM